VTNHNYVDEMIQEMTVGGDVLGAGSAEYESARRSQIARFDGVRPRVVVRCRVPEDVAQALAFAREEGLHVALRSGGHCFAGRSSTTGVVIDLSGMNEVLVSDGTVTVGAGARSAEVCDALAADDRTIAAGGRANRRDPQGAPFTVSQLVIASQGA
jgi:FAD/FMN-containing dehydrogenase